MYSCQSWREANEVLVKADSLLANGMIMRDTAVLGGAIHVLDNHAGQAFAREELAKAYYLMGRNLDDYHHNFADAADRSFEADRLTTRDLIFRERINSCMGYLRHLNALIHCAEWMTELQIKTYLPNLL